MPNYELAAERAAKKYGLNPAIFKAQLRQESGLRPGLTSSAGAQGIAQFMPATAKAYGVNLHDGRVSDDLDGAARYMRDNLDRTNDDYAAALSIYNSGKPDAYKDPNFAHGQTYNYVRTILGAAKVKAPKTGTTKAATKPASQPTTTQTVTTPGVNNAPLRRQLVGDFLQHGGVTNSNAVLSLAGAYSQAADIPGTTTTTKVKAPKQQQQASTKRSASPKVMHGTANFEGHQVAAWIAPALQYARKHGWKGTVNSGYRTLADQTRIYNSGVRPAAKPGTSNHEGADYPRGAVDVSDPEVLSRILAASPYAKKLQWAGAKDRVHFSHPHNGSY